MTIKKFTLAASAAALAIAPVAAQADSADRSAAPVSAEQQIGGAGTLLGALALAFLGAYIFFAVDGDDDFDDDDEPVSA